MVEENSKPGFTKKQNQLLNISSTSKVIAWFSLAFFVFQFGSELYNFTTFLEWQRGAPYGEDLFYLIRNFSRITTILIQGFVIWLILLGISLGLRMIIETNFNYQGSSLDNASSATLDDGSNEDNPAVFYNPGLVFRLDDWLRKGAIIAISVSIIDNVLRIPTTHQILMSFNFVEWVPWVGAIILNIIETIVKIMLINFGFKALGTILITMMEIEFNSRRADKLIHNPRSTRPGDSAAQV